MEKKQYFKSPCEDYNVHVAADIEQGRVFDITDEKWGHPELMEGWSATAASIDLHDPYVSIEEKKAKIEATSKAVMKALTLGDSGSCDIQVFTVPGCPEEPETSVEVRVYRPKNLTKKKARCMFYSMGGALVMRDPNMFPFEEMCTRYNCVIVTAMYRTSLEAPYPAAINDLHAAYKWMIENAEMLKINPKNVVLYGMSSGGHLITALAFRLKRYGYSPKGVIAVVPQTDDRENDLLSHKVYAYRWDAATQRQALHQWMGDNFANSQIGPEALANHATVEDCIGYPPLFLHTLEFDPDRDNSREFFGKVLEAKTYAEFHSWGGAHHGAAVYDGANPYSKVVKEVIDKNIEDCFKYDLRRPWVVEEHENK